MNIIHISRVHARGRFGDHGNLRANNKCDLVARLDDFTTSVFDPSARTFSDYADTVFISYNDRQLQLHEAQRIDLAWDTYIPDSVMSSTMQRRRTGIWRRVLDKT